MKRIARSIAFLISILSCFATLSGCEKNDAITLRVLVEESTYEAIGFHSQLNRWIAEFEAEHEGITIVLEQLPQDSESRNPMLQQIRSELMSGNGPDILILPNALSDQDALNPKKPLFNDVAQAMRNGLFSDLSDFYDQDDSLGTADLQEAVMDAGVVDGHRYVLPLRYDLPVVYVDKTAFSQTGLDAGVFESSVIGYMDAVTEMENGSYASNFRMHWIRFQFFFNFFPKLIDYDTGKVSLQKEDVSAFLRSYQDYWVRLLPALKSSALSQRPFYKYYCADGAYWTDTGNFLFIGSLQQGMETVTIARTKGIELDMYPIRATDGSIIADVTWYGAVSSGCKNKELAYEFLRAFLTEDFQWEKNLEDIYGIWQPAAYGWPVRAKGSVSALAEVIEKRTRLSFSANNREVNLEGIGDQEMPILGIHIDQARFSIPLEREFANALSALYDRHTQQATNIDIDQMAQDWLDKLQLHIDEG